MDLSRNNITFLKNVPSYLTVDSKSGWRYNYFDGSLTELSSFIKQIGNDKIYLLIPLFASSKSLSRPTLNLSEPFLVDNNSNSALILKFILEQWFSSGFEVKEGTIISFSFKFKRVWISYK